MGIIFDDVGKTSTKKLVMRVLEATTQNLMVFVYISRIFDLHRDKPPASELSKVDQTIDLTLKNPRLDLESKKRHELIEIVKEIYRSKSFIAIRSEILENFISQNGPYSIKTGVYNCYIEPTIKHGKRIIGNNNRKIDSVFHNNDTLPMEFVECKSNIASVIPADMTLNRMQTEKREKVEYLIDAYNYLSTAFCEPAIYIACYNNNYERQLTNVQQNWGYHFINFISPNELYQIISEKLAV
ncbi:hypothetical protein D3C75_388720 [compost metagenome]